MKQNILKGILITTISLSIFLSCGGTAKTSPEMKGFMSMIKGQDGDLKKALIKYGMNEDKADDFALMKAPYIFTDPSIKKTEKKNNMDCYLMNMKHGIVDSDFEICWKNKKITGIKIF